MNTSQDVIGNYEATAEWMNRLEQLPESAWFRPIAEGKASIAEIVSHLMNWDKYLMTDVIPSVQKGGGMVFPDFDPFNAIAYAYAKSGVAGNQLLDEFRAARTSLCKLLSDIGEETLRKPTTANGVELCPHSGTPYSLLYIVQEFTEHDHHHQQQIDLALQTSPIGEQ